MRKVLVITYYWPPSGGSGVQRWLKFAKYFREFGWDPIIYTPENPERPVIDDSLIKDVPQNLTILKQPIIEPYNLYKTFIGIKKDQKINAAFLSETKKPKLTEKISVWIRGNFFIPDAKFLWVKPSIKYLSEYLEHNKIDAIVSTGPPHSTHLIAKSLNKKFNIPWVADFRDLWTDIDFYDQLKLSYFADRKHHKLENLVLANATAVVTVSKTCATDLNRVYKRDYNVITNGYDQEDLNCDAIEMDKKFSLSHIGSLVKDRNPETLWSILNELCNEIPGFAEDLEIKLVGKTDYSVIESLTKNKLLDYTNKIEYIPHNDVIKIQQSSQILLLLINNTPNAQGILTGKFFEYLSAKRPILAIGPDNSDAIEILLNTKAGVIANFEDRVLTKKYVLDYYNQFKNGNLKVNSNHIEKFSRKSLTKDFADLLNSII